jgi:hypothetical protein
VFILSPKVSERVVIENLKALSVSIDALDGCIEHLVCACYKVEI